VPTPGAPVAPTWIIETNDSVTLYPPSGADERYTLEYGISLIDNAYAAKWQDDLAFSGLLANVKYYFFARYKFDADKNNVSEASESLGFTISAEIANDSMRQPYFYSGTGELYDGYKDGTSGKKTTSGGVTITYPYASTFNADGFFPLEGNINNSDASNYAYVVLTKSDDSDLSTTYFVNGDFKQRIWLRFGAGEYKVEVHGIHSLELNTAGNILSGTIFVPSIAFKVTNTRTSDASADSSIPDMRFIYPSYVVQSDDKVITDKVEELLGGLVNPADTDKIKAIHDYMIKNTVYDMDSLDINLRKKQDAVTVLGKRYKIDTQYNTVGGHYLAVCEGYANTFAALGRAAGLEVKYISSEKINHAWNNVLVNGVWKFIDVTWDDPVRKANVTGDYGPNYVSAQYYLLNKLNGINNDHPGAEIDNSRSAAGNKPPWRRDMPPGWY
jgi:hypothetical protein